MKRHLERLLRHALTAAAEAGALQLPRDLAVELEVPKQITHGDLASNVAMVLARSVGQAPRAIAESIRRHLHDPDGWLVEVDVAGPGFMNFRFSPTFWRMLLAEALAAGDDYGRSVVGEGRRVQVEFVSANPTGPLHVGHGRGAVIGDAIARLLEAVGYVVEREYYVNDYGRQVELLGRSTLARYRALGGAPLELPPGGYPGEYLVDVARALRADVGDALDRMDEAAAAARAGEFASRMLLDEIRADLARFDIQFDRFVSERQLHEKGALDRALATLPAELLYADDGALFFRTSRFGDEKDRPVRRRTGEPTYFGGDVAHFHETLSRGFERLVNVLGADHHGYVARLRAVLEGFGRSNDLLQVVLVQIVSLTRGGLPVRMGKREGEFVGLRDVLDEVGSDAARFFFLLRKADSQLEFDLDLAKKQSTDNPVFYVQYAHARIASVLRQAAEAGIALAAQPDLTPLGAAEVDVLRPLAGYPDVVETAARNLEPHRIVFYALDLAAAFHRYYNQHRILTDDPALTQARLALVRSTQRVLRSALGLAGVVAPERM